MKSSSEGCSIPINIDHKLDRPVYLQIVDEIKGLCYRGKLPAGTRLPTVRLLAETLDINPNTVARAYRELEQAGQISTMVGRGTFVAESSAETIDNAKMNQLERELQTRCQQLKVPMWRFLDYIIKERMT